MTKKVILQKTKSAFHSFFAWIKLRKHSVANSFAFALVKSFALILVLIWLLYLVKPAGAHLYAELSSFDEAELCELQSSSTNCYFIDEAETNVMLTSTEALEISSEVIVDGTILSESEKLVIYPKDSALYDDEQAVCGLSLQGKLSQVYMPRSNYSGDRFTCDMISISSSDPPQIVYIYGDIFIESDKNSSQKRKLDLNSNSISFKHTPNLIKPHSKSQRAEMCIIATIPFYQLKEIETSVVQELRLFASGQLSISYTPTPNEYKLNAQELWLYNKWSKSNNLCFKYSPISKTGVIYGNITEGTISQLSLFPSFRSWFFSSALLTPTATISIVLSAIAQFRKKKEQKDNEVT